MDARIKSISFLDRDDKRRRVLSDKRGKFSVVVTGHSSVKNYPMSLTAQELVDRVFDGDPVIELTDRSRMRIRQGGTGHMRVDAECVLITHDEYYAKNR